LQEVHQELVLPVAHLVVVSLPVVPLVVDHLVVLPQVSTPRWPQEPS
jgi:hypothetical protein